MKIKKTIQLELDLKELRDKLWHGGLNVSNNARFEPIIKTKIEYGTPYDSNGEEIFSGIRITYEE